MNFNEKLKLLFQIKQDITPFIQSKLNDSSEREIVEEVKILFDEIHSIIDDDSFFSKIISILIKMDSLEVFYKIISQPIHLNQFTDKYGNNYILARTTIKVRDKKAWVNAYVGKLSEFPKGLEDPQAIEKGNVLVRRKLFDKYRTSFNT